MRDRAAHVGRDETTAGPTPAPQPAPAHPLHALQQQHGNQAVVAALGAQAKLEVGAVGDPAEAEADRIAAQVLRQLSAGGSADVGRQAPAGPLARQVRRRATEPASGAPGHGLEGGEALPETESAIERRRGGGAPMDPTTLARMESAFGADLSHVRIHTGTEASGLSRDLNARAFTTGNDVFFGSGEYRPGTRGGDEVLAHELTHTLQQRGGAKRVHRLWNLNAPKWEETKEVTTLSSGQSVLFFTDKTGGKMVVKRDDEPVGLMKFAADLQGQVSGTPSVITKNLTGNDRLEIIGLLMEGGKMTGSSWATLGSTKFAESQPGETPKEKGVNFQLTQYKTAGNIVAMSMASGSSAKELAKVDESGGSKFRNLLMDQKYLFDLGLVTAVDLFMNNADRVLNGNLGNWFVDAKNSNVLIDSVDKWSGITWRGENLAGEDNINFLKPSKLQDGSTGRECLRGLMNGMADQAGDEGVFAWAKQACPNGGGTNGDFIANGLTAGIVEGRKRLLKKYGKKTKEKKGLAGVAEMRSIEDRKKGQIEQEHSYMSVLEARIQALKAQK